MMSVRSCVAVVRCVFYDENLQLCLWALVIVGFCAVREETKETPTAPYPHRKNVLGFEDPNAGPLNFISANGVSFQGGFLF